METMSLLIAIAVVVLVGGGGAVFLYLKSRPKVQSWNAYVYQLGEGKRDLTKIIDNKTVSHLTLKDLIPYAEDILVKKDIDVGKTVYELKSLGISTNPVNADDVKVWGTKKIVHVLIHKGTATILKTGYDVDSGEIIFSPLPREQIELVQSQIILQMSRLKKDKNTLAALTSWVVVGISMIALVAVAYFMGQGVIKSSEINADAFKLMAEKNKESAELYREAIREISSGVTTVKSSTPVVQLGKVTNTTQHIESIK